MKVTIRLLHAEFLQFKNHNLIWKNLLHNHSSENNSSDFFGINDESKICREKAQKTVAIDSNGENVQSSQNKHSTFQSHFGTIRIEPLPHLNDQPFKNANGDITLINDLSKNNNISGKKANNSSNLKANKVKPKMLANSKFENTAEFSQPIHRPNADKNETFKPTKLSDTTLAQNKAVEESNKIASTKHSAFNVVKEIRKNNMQKSHDISKSRITEHIVGTRNLGFKKDAKGFNTFTNQVQNWNSVPRYQVVDELRKSIIYEDDNILGINKPYGLSVMGDSKNLYCIHSLASDLAKVMHLKSDQLHLVHRLDKDCTGVLLLAKNTVTQARVNEMFRQRLVQKVYWAITVGVPDRPEGIIDIPLAEKDFNGKHKIFVAPVYDENGRVIEQNNPNSSLTPNSDAKTEYEIMRRTCSAALLKLQSRTGFKHQIRVHLAYGLNCPILGDHKYSHLNEMKPQRLPDTLLDKLHVRQAKVRTLPLHLHAFSLILPSLEGDPKKHRLSNTLEIAATKLPFHFKTNMKCLGLSITSKD